MLLQMNSKYEKRIKKKHHCFLSIIPMCLLCGTPLDASLERNSSHDRTRVVKFSRQRKSEDTRRCRDDGILLRDDEQAANSCFHSCCRNNFLQSSPGLHLLFAFNVFVFLKPTCYNDDLALNINCPRQRRTKAFSSNQTSLLFPSEAADPGVQSC